MGILQLWYDREHWFNEWAAENQMTNKRKRGKRKEGGYGSAIVKYQSILNVWICMMTCASFLVFGEILHKKFVNLVKIVRGIRRRRRRRNRRRRRRRKRGGNKYKCFKENGNLIRKYMHFRNKIRDMYKQIVM